jgi:hypothetical protein
VYDDAPFIAWNYENKLQAVSVESIEAMKTILTWLFWLAVIGGAAWYFLHQHQSQVREHRTAQIRQQQKDASIVALALKYNASQDWQKTLTNKTALFTVDVQDALLNKSAPLEFTGDLVDIRRDGGRIVADFTVHTAAGFLLWLRLICTEDQRKILTDKDARYAIIADIQKVLKQGDLNIVSAVRDENGDFDDPTYEVNWDSDTYWVSGACLDLKKLGE